MVAAIATTVALTVTGLAFTAAPATADTAPPAGLEDTVTAVPLPTAQIDGVAWTQAIVGNTVYVGGEFTTARPAGAAAGVNTTGRANLMAYTLSTGVMTSWNPGANGAIRAIVPSADGSRIYVAGAFTTIGGAARNRIAAFSTATGALLPWNPGANAVVADVATAGNSVWLVGNFSSVAGGARTRVAAVNATTGALLPFTTAVTGGYGVKAIEVNPAGDKIVVAGSFTAANGSTNPGRGMAALNAATGASMEWKVNSVVRNAGENASINSLASDGDSVYGTGYDYGGGPEDGFEDVFRASWTDGTIEWLTDCHGDNYGVSAAGGVVYTVSHDHYCGNIGGFPQTDPKWTFKHSLAYAKDYEGNSFGWDPYGYKSYVGQPAGTMLHWFPEWQVGTYTGKSQAGWDVKATEDYTVVGGEFLRINNIAQQGLVRFGKKSVGAPTDGPQLSGSAWNVTPLSLRAGEIRISWPANTDRDSAKLTYELFRQDKGATPIFTGTAESTFWNRPDLKFVDSTVTAGTTYQYRVRATDPDGNVATGGWVSVTATTTQASDYALDVLDDGAEHYWPLGETSGTLGADWAQNGDVTVNGATRNAAGQNLATPSKATTFAGTGTSFGVTKSAEPGKDVVSIEAWFKTTSTDGGKIVGFGNSATGNSGNYDRHIYIDGAGRVTFGVHPGGVRTVESNTGYNDGQWHHVVGTLGGDGMTLYLDGSRVGARADTTSGQAYTGFWRIGGDNIGGWPNVGASHYLNGTISDVAIYPAVLTRAQVDSHWTKSGRTSTLPAAPVDAYGKSVFDLGPSLYWRLGESGGTVAADSGPDSVSGTYYGNVTKGVAGALQGTGNTAIRTNPNGNDQTGVSSNKQFSNPTVFAVEAWFKTDSTSGGKIVGFGNAQTGMSSGYDRHVYMSGDGRVKFGAWTGAAQIIETGPGFNDNQWHHVVAQLSSSGMQLYLDGALASTGGNTAAQDYAGYWRVGGDSGWEGDSYWRGSIDEVAVYPQPLTPQQVEAHHDLGSLGFVNVAPTASFSSIASGLSVAFDGSVSSDPEGPIASYAWSFGDGQNGTGATPTHVYPHSGTFQVTLTVVDGHGASSAITQPVTVTGPNVNPTASFTESVTHQRATFDAGASTDVDGEIVSYAWAFGDGTTGSGVSPVHTYAAAGTYTVSLLVTDDRGGSASSSRTITTTVPPGAPADAYGAAVYNLSPTIYWRLNETTGSTVRDSGVNDNPGTYYGDVEKGVAGALATAGNTAVSLHPNGGDQTGVASTRRFNNPTTLAVESWFKTDSTAGGKIVSFGVAQTGTSTNHDRNLYMTSDGRVKFGVWTGEMQLVETGPGFNDNQWHHVVAQLSSAGMQLYLDGDLVSTNPNTLAENYNGYWRVGGDTPWEGETYWRGAVDEVAIYPAPLTAAQVDTHYELGKNGFVNAPPTASFTAVMTDLSGAFDAGASTDLDGPIASYSWDFGDDTTGTGKTTTHDYAAAGTYDVVLTVTDGQGMTDSVTHQVEASAANQAPTAAFSTAVDGLKVTANGSASADPDGTIASYEWDFGDGTTGTGATAQHTYAAAGSYDIELTVTDNRGAIASVTHEVDVAAVNQAPVAAFTSSADNLVVAFNGTGSTDPDGTIASYSWQFGDGGSGTGATPSHTYATAGTYTVTLTVTDNSGATNAKSAPVTVAATPTSAVLARDGFERTVSNGWGSAEVGGAWTVSPTAARFSVAGGAAAITSTASTNLIASLRSVSSTNTLLATSFSVDKIANAHYVSFIGRQVGADQYLLRVRIATDGSVILHVMRGGTAIGAGYTVPGLTIVAGDTYNVAFEVKGTSPTALSGKIWKSTAAEPAAWQVVRSDSTAAMQAAGSIGVSSLVPSAANAYPLKVTFPTLTATDPTGTTPPPANAAPVAAFTSTVSGLGVSVNGSTSTDSDGTVTAYAWAFGDGGTGTGATASHTYAAAGTYTVSLTVTDDDGATNTKTAQVTVTAPPAPGVLARDLFERTGTNGWGTADQGGAWSIVGTAARFSVAGGTGRLSVASGQAQNANLLGVSSANSRLTAEFSVDKVVDGQYIGFVGRQVGAGQYILRLRPENGGQVRLYVLRDATAVGASFLVPGLTLAVGEKYTVSFQVSGTAPTSLNAKVWKSSDPEPAAWQVTRSDSTAAMQSPGSVGVFSWLPSTAAAAGTVIVGFESISVTTP